MYNVAVIAEMDEYAVALLWAEMLEVAEEITIVISLAYLPLILLLLDCLHLCANTENIHSDIKLYSQSHYVAFCNFFANTFATVVISASILANKHLFNTFLFSGQTEN